MNNGIVLVHRCHKETQEICEDVYEVDLDDALDGELLCIY